MPLVLTSAGGIIESKYRLEIVIVYFSCYFCKGIDSLLLNLIFFEILFFQKKLFMN